MSSIESRLNPSSSVHFEEHHENSETLLCVQHDSTCAVLIELAGTTEQQETIAQQSERAVEAMDRFFGGRFAELFAGTHVRYTHLETSGGGVLHDQNDIEMDIDKMSMSLVDAEEHLVSIGVLDTGDWTRPVDEQTASEPASTAYYNTIHEFAHLMDVRETPSDPWIGIPTEYSPTKYGRTKPNEAFAEAFTYLVLGAPISDEARLSVEAKVRAFIERRSARQQ